MIIDDCRLVGDRRAGDAHSAARRPAATTGTFKPDRGTCVLSADLGRVLGPGDAEIGLARPDAAACRSAISATRTRPSAPSRSIDGVRYSVPGDRARMRADGSIEVLGRDSVTINSGGEKIFAEEVEHGDQAPPRRVRRGGGRPAERALGQRGGRAWCSCAPARPPRRAELLAECGQAHRALQAAQRDHLRRRDRAQPERKGRLPLGARDGDESRREGQGLRTEQGRAGPPVGCTPCTGRWRAEPASTQSSFLSSPYGGAGSYSIQRCTWRAQSTPRIWPTSHRAMSMPADTRPR